MKRVAMYVIAVVFLLLNWKDLGFPETGKLAEDIMKEEGLITEEEYNAAQKTRIFGSEKMLPQTEQPKSSYKIQDQHQIELGTEISHITYKEPGVMQEKGMMYGVDGSYVYRTQVTEYPKGIDIWMLKIDGRFSYGQVDYVNSGTMDNIDDYILEFRGLWGCDISVLKLKPSTLTPFIGIGYRYLNDDFAGTTSTGALGYERESNYIYSPVGIEVVTPLKNGWSIGATTEYDIFWHGKQKSNLSDARLYNPVTGYYRYDDIENSQDSGYGVRGSIKLQKKAKKLDFVIEPYIRYWNIKESKQTTTSTISENGLWIITGTFVEPDNNSTEIGCKLAVKF